jgi:hypothetical protein
MKHAADVETNSSENEPVTQGLSKSQFHALLVSSHRAGFPNQPWRWCSQANIPTWTGRRCRCTRKGESSVRRRPFWMKHFWNRFSTDSRICQPLWRSSCQATRILACKWGPLMHTIRRRVAHSCLLKDVRPACCSRSRDVDVFVVA